MNVAPRILSAAELLALELPEPRWAVPDVVPEGLTILAGRPKLGKSWLGLGLLVAAAAGGRALGRVGVEPGDALGLMLEDSAKRLQSRLAMLLGPDAAPGRLYLAREWPRADKGGVQAIASWLEQHRSARLVVIDTLARFRATRKGRERGYSDDVDDLEPLQQLAIRRQLSIVVLHHLRKGGADDWIDTISGTLGLAGVADGLLGLFRARGESQATLKVTGRDVEERDLGLRFDPPSGTWWLLGEATETVDLTAERQAVIGALTRMGKPVRARALAGYVGKSYDATLKLLQRMRDDGQVDGGPSGWRLARVRECPVSGVSGLNSTPDIYLAPPPDTPDTPDMPDTLDGQDTSLRESGDFLSLVDSYGGEDEQ